MIRYFIIHTKIFSMSSKKIIQIIFMSLCLCMVVPAFAGTPASEVPKEVRAHQIESRLIEIRNMAKTNLTSAEKKDLRKEVKSLRKESRNGGIYLSVGAIIIIILLLILLL